MIEILNNFETSLIEEFRLHPSLVNLQAIAWEDFLEILIQRRFLSLSIVNIYEFVIDALTDPQIKQTVRSILHEEFPRNTKGIPLPSHRELLFQDLLNLGATPDRILVTPETQSTQTIRAESYQFLVNCLGQSHCQVGLIAFLRFWAEVLVSVEYTCFWPRISERLSNSQSNDKVRSEFYYFHMIHDSRRSNIGQERLLGGLTHAQELALHLRNLISSESALQFCTQAEKHACQLKYQFYNQFTF